MGPEIACTTYIIYDTIRHLVEICISSILELNLQKTVMTKIYFLVYKLIFKLRFF